MSHQPVLDLLSQWRTVYRLFVLRLFQDKRKNTIYIHPNYWPWRTNWHAHE